MPRKPPKSNIPQNARVSVLTPGHRGIAARLLKNPNLESYREHLRQNGRDYEISQSEVEAFLNDGHILEVHSSNVNSFQYDAKKGEMFVIYKGNAKYLYKNVSMAEAMMMATAQSKGNAVWRFFRVLGSRTEHKKPYERIS